MADSENVPPANAAPPNATAPASPSEAELEASNIDLLSRATALNLILGVTTLRDVKLALKSAGWQPTAIQQVLDNASGLAEAAYQHILRSAEDEDEDGGGDGETGAEVPGAAQETALSVFNRAGKALGVLLSGHFQGVDVDIKLFWATDEDLHVACTTSLSS